MDFLISKNIPLKNFSKHWQFCVGSGRAKLALRTDYCKQLKRIHDELGIKRVRFHGIFHDDMHTLHSLKDVLPIPGASRFTEQSFRFCGIAYDNLMDCGMQPFVELTFMPSMLASKNKRGLFFYKPNISMPKSDVAWESYIKDFIRFLLRRYGKQRVRSWFFEIWNEPDLKIAFFAGKQADYFHLYEITAKAIRSVDADLIVGGPATSGSRWIAEFTAHCKKHGLPLDFITTHQYAGDPLGGVEEQGDANESIGLKRLLRLMSVLRDKPNGTVLEGLRHVMRDKSETEDTSSDTFAKAAPIVKAQAGGLPVYYTEWNCNAIFSAYTNDTRKVAAYDVKTALAIEDYVEGSSIWCFSDIFEELHPFPEEFHGGFGMLSQNGIPKPHYHAMKLLGQVGNERYVMPEALGGEIGMAAFKSDNGTQVALFRQKMKNLDLPAQRASVTIELDKPPKSVTVYRIDEEHGNPLKIWENMGSTLDLTPGEAADIALKSEVRPMPLEHRYENGKLSFEASLKVNDLWFVFVQ